MNKRKISFTYEEGDIDGVYFDCGKATPLVIIVNGHNGFYNYGMFPYIQQQLCVTGISSYSFNYSHGGITGDGDYFEDLHKYEQNCMRLETEDLFYILNNLQSGEFNEHSQIILLAHSLGGVPAIFGTTKALKNNIKVDGIVLISTVKTLRFWPNEMIQEWATNGVYFKKNNRTKQELPQGFEFLQEVLKSDTDWNVKKAISKLNIPILIVHGENDEAIPVEHAKSLYESATENNSQVSLKLISGATHTYNTKHPFDSANKYIDALINCIIDWIIKSIKKPNA